MMRAAIAFTFIEEYVKIIKWDNLNDDFNEGCGRHSDFNEEDESVFEQQQYQHSKLGNNISSYFPFDYSQENVPV